MAEPEFRIYSRVEGNVEVFTWRLVGGRYSGGRPEIFAQPDLDQPWFESRVLAEQNIESLRQLFETVGVHERTLEWTGHV